VERLEALELGGGLAEHVLTARDHDNAQAARQLRAARDAFQAHAASADWKRRVTAFNKALASEEGGQALAEARERLVHHLAASEASGDDAREAVAVWDEAVRTLREKKVAGLTKWLDSRFDDALAARESKSLGREGHSPLTTNQWICIAVGTGLGILAVLACLGMPFCHCCYLGWILLAYASVVAACTLGVR
jgi:hypothetical protein